MYKTTEIKIERNIEIAGERFALLVETRHGAITARTAVHRADFGRHIGGSRMVRVGCLAELGHLASRMTEKCTAAGLPADGQKTLVTCPDGVPKSPDERAAILAAHIAAVVAVDEGVIFGPDMGVPEAVLDRVAAAAPALRDHLTGLGEEHGGLAIDQNGFTGVGLAHAITLAFPPESMQTMRVSVQGFGAVGAHAAARLDRSGARIVGASVAGGALLARTPEGLPIAALYDAWVRGGDEGVLHCARSHAAQVRLEHDPDVLLELPTDIFVPAARTTVLAAQDELSEARAENPDVREALRFHAQTGVRMVAEGANHPLTFRAEQLLEACGVRILPDYIVNLGGLVGCFFEWLRRQDISANPASRVVVARDALAFTEAAITRNVGALLACTGGARAAAAEITGARRHTLLQAMAAWRFKPTRAAMQHAIDDVTRAA